MKPIAKGRAAILGNITVQETPNELHTFERAILVTFDSLEEFRKAVEYGAIDALPFGDPSRENNGHA